MLSDSAYAFLCKFREGFVHYSKLSSDELDTAKYYVSQQLLKVRASNLRKLESNYIITPKGNEQLLLYEQAKDEQAKQEAAQHAAKREHDAQLALDRDKKFRHDWRVAIVSGIIGATVGSLLTLFVEHFDEIIALFA